TFELKRIELRNVTNDGFTGTIYIQVNNPNAVGLTIKDLRYEAFINDSSAATGRIENPIDIPANGSATAELPVVASLTNMKGGLFGLFSDRFTYSVKGEAVFGKWYGSYTLPFTTKTKTMGGKDDKPDKKGGSL
ncbi:MAG: LEA type 2 family protein, partial [Nitrospirae bacterium]|nr:LEA type 2 family protein [Nitrospirota bacterium]